MSGVRFSMWRGLLAASSLLLFFLFFYEPQNSGTIRDFLRDKTPDTQTFKISKAFGILGVVPNFYGWNPLNMKPKKDTRKHHTTTTRALNLEGESMMKFQVAKNHRRVKRTDASEAYRRRSMGDTPVNNLDIQKLTVTPNPATVGTLDLDTNTFISKHVRDGKLAPDATDQGTRLLSSLRRELKDDVYSRSFQTVVFPTDKITLENAIKLKAEDVWKRSGAPTMVAIDNKPYLLASSDLAGPTPNYNKAIEFLEKAGMLRPGESVSSLQTDGVRAVQQRLDRALGSVTFEIRDPIVLKQSETGRVVLVERIGDDPTDLKSGPTKGKEFKGWGLSEVGNQELHGILYTKVEVPEGTLISDINPNDLKPGGRKWEVHFESAGTASSPSSSNPSLAQKNYDYTTKPAFTDLDDLNRQRTILIAEKYKNVEKINNDLYKNSKNPNVGDHIKNTLGDLENKLNSLKLATVPGDSINPQPNLNQEVLSKGDIKKRIKFFEEIVKPLDLATVKLKQASLKLEQDLLDHQKTMIRETEKSLPVGQISDRLVSDKIKEQRNIPKGKQVTVVDFTFDTEQELLSKKKGYVQAQLEYLEGMAKNLPNSELDLSQRKLWDAHTEVSKYEAELKAAKSARINLDDAINTRLNTHLDASCGGGPSGGRRRKRSCPCARCQRKTVETVPVKIKQAKLERKMTKLDKLKKFIKEIFPSAQKGGGSKGGLPSSGKVKPDLNLEEIVKSPSLTKRVAGSKFVQNFLGLPDVEQAYMGPKTVQNALAPNKKSFTAKVGKVGGAIQKANYAFLVRDFTKAAIRGDPVQMSIMGGMFGLQMGAGVLEKISTGQKVLGMTAKVSKSTAKAMMVTGRLVGGALSVVGAGFDIYSIVNSGKCLAQKSDNKALCLAQDPKCMTENEVCEGRDNVLDIVTNSLSIIGAAVTIATFAVPVVGTVIGLVSLAITIFSEIYQAKTFLNNFEKDIPLYENERWKQLGKRLIGQNVSDYLLELKQQKKVNTRLLENIREFLIQNSDFFWAQFAPARNHEDAALLDNTVKVRESDYVYRKYSRWSPDPNRMVDGAKIYKIEDFNYFCRPNEYSSLSGYDFLQGYSYYCKNAVGIRIENQKSAKDLYAYFNLEKGLDVIIGFESVSNYFDVYGGTKEFTGGDENDIFVVNDKFGGFLEGGAGTNSLRLSDNLHGSSVEITNKKEEVGDQWIQIDGVTATLTEMHHIQGRTTGREIIHAACFTKSIDGAGGQDQIVIDAALTCSRLSPMSLRIDVRPGLTVKNDYEGSHGTFLYHLLSDPILSGISRESQIYIRAASGFSNSSSATAAPEHQFVTSSEGQSLKISWSWVNPGGHFVQIHENVKNTLSTIFVQASSNNKFRLHHYDYQILIQTKDGMTISLVNDASGPSTQLDIPSSEIQAVVLSSVANETCVLNIRRLDGDPSTTKKKLEFEIHFVASADFKDSRNMAVTQDGAILVVSKKDGGWNALLYFSLEHLKIKNGARVLKGGLWNQNFFQISNPSSSTTKIQKILGGMKDDHFLLQQIPSGLEMLSSGSSGMNILELGEDLKFQFKNIKTDFKNKVIEFHDRGSFSKRKLALDGSFEIFLGQYNTSDEFHAGCSTKKVDLRGGPGDEIIIPRFPIACPGNGDGDLQNAKGIEIQIQVWPGTTIKNYYGYSGKISYIVQTPVFEPQDSAQRIDIQIQSPSLENYVFLTHISAENLKNITVQNDGNGSTMFVETFLQISFPTEKMPQVITKDGAILTLVPLGSETEEKRAMYKPTFYFELTTGYLGNRSAIKGNQYYSNHFKLVDGTFSKIMGGKSDDHFLLGAKFHCDELWGGNGGVDVIEILENNNNDQRSEMLVDADFDLNFQNNVITFPVNRGSQCRIHGDSFQHIFGQKGQNEKVTVTPSILSVDLRGGNSPFSPDSIIIPRNEDSSKYNLTIALQNNTRLFSEGQHGSTTYHFLQSAGHSEVTLRNSSTTYTSIFALDFLARDLKISKDGSGIFTIEDLSSTRNRLKLNMNPAEFSESLHIFTKEQAQVIFFSHGNGGEFDAAFKFTLTESSDRNESRGLIVQGGKLNPNFFILSGIYKAVHGGQKSDTFIIGPDSQVELVDGGDLEDDTLQFDESVSGQVRIDLSSGFFSRTRENNELKTEMKGNLHHVQGRSSASEILITNPNAKSINLQGTQDTPEERDYILIPENPDDNLKSEYNLFIDYYDSTQLLVFNGEKTGKFIYNVENPAGAFQLFNIYDPTISSANKIGIEDLDKPQGEEQEMDTGDQNPGKRENIQETFHLSSTSFFDLFSVEAEAEAGSNVVKIQMRQYETSNLQQANFTATHFPTYEKLFETFEQYTKLEDWRPELDGKFKSGSSLMQLGDSERDIEEETKTSSYFLNEDLEFSTEPNVSLDPDADSDSELPVNPLVRFPTFTTSDDYEIVINHLGGIHAVTSIPTSTFSYQTSENNMDTQEIAGEVINQHIQIVNDLGISLIISLVDDLDGDEDQNSNLETKMVTTMIFMGGDDEIDSLMNHASISSHLVGNAGGDTNFFVIFPTLNQVPVYIYLPQVQLKNSVPVPDQANILNLAAFFDRPFNPYELPDEEQEETENPNTIETTTPMTTMTMNQDSLAKNSSKLHNFDEERDKDIRNQTKHDKSKIRKPKIFIPQVIQEEEADLRITVKYLNDPFDYESEELMQEIVFVNGVEDYRKLSVRLYVATYRIEKDEDTEEWSLVPEKLVITGPSSPASSFRQNSLKDVTNESKKSRNKRQAPGEHKVNVNDYDDDDDSSTESDELPTGIRYVFLSHADLVEHLDFGIPIQLDKTTKTLDGPKSFYRNGESLIITNQVDLDPSLNFNDIWRSSKNDNDDEDESASPITIVLLDIKESMEQENFTITIKNLDNFKTPEDPIPDFVMSFDSIDQLPDYKEAVEEMEKKKVWNQKRALGIIILLLVLILLLTVYLLLFILRNFGRGKREKPKRKTKTRDAVNFENNDSHEQEKERFLTDQSRTTHQIITLAEQEMELKSLLLPLQHQHQQWQEQEEQEAEEERERRVQELMRCQKYWMDSHQWTHWEQLKATGECFCQAVDFIPAWRTPVQMPMPTYPNEQHNAGASDHDNQ